VRIVAGVPSSEDERVRAAKVIAALSLATDYGTGLPLEHGLRSTLVAMRLCERLGVDRAAASQVYLACPLFYVGCTADAEVAAEDAGFGDARIEEVEGRFSVGDVEEYLDIIADTAGPLGLALRDLAADERATIGAELEERFAPFSVDGGYVLPGVALAAIAG
jgi:hypothetical protein